MSNEDKAVAITIIEELNVHDAKVLVRLRDLLLLVKNAPMQYELAALNLQSKVAKYKKG